MKYTKWDTLYDGLAGAVLAYAITMLILSSIEIERTNKLTESQMRTFETKHNIPANTFYDYMEHAKSNNFTRYLEMKSIDSQKWNSIEEDHRLGAVTLTFLSVVTPVMRRTY